MRDLVLLVLAGGMGTRFSPFVTDKILFPFFDKPLADYTVKRVIPKEVTKIVAVTNRENDEYFRSLTSDVPVETYIQENALGMADAILTARKSIEGKEILILIADDLFDPTLPAKIIDTAQKHDAFAVIPGLTVDSYFPGGYLVLDGERVKQVIEKPGEGNTPSSMITISGHYFKDSSTLLKLLGETNSSEDDVYEKAISKIMEENVCIVHRYDGPFVSLKYAWNVLDVLSLLLTEIKDYRGENVSIKENVILEGPVYIGDNVKIFENTKIVGPAYIGSNSIIGNNNVIRHAMLGSGCVTGFNTDITRSFVGHDCWFHSNYIGDSVLEGNISLGSGSVLANLRLDEQVIQASSKNSRISTKRNKLGSLIAQNVRIGVNASIMPGVKIGSDSFIGAGLTLPKDVESEQLVYQQSQLVITKNIHAVTQDRGQFKAKI